MKKNNAHFPYFYITLVHLPRFLISFFFFLLHLRSL
jgi:hypothetical protein